MKRNYKLIIGFIIGIFIVTVVYADIAVNGNNISYTDNYSLSSTNVQEAIDQTYTKLQSAISNCSNYNYSNTNFVIGYSYNETEPNKCITGEEDTCVETECYESGKCKAGDIIDYKVNDNEIVRFHVMFDDCGTLTMQSQKNTVYNVAWNKGGGNTLGPVTVLNDLNTATSTWNNLDDITYTAGTTTFKINKYTSCNSLLSCINNKYTLGTRVEKARIISFNEAVILGCNVSSKTCPIWMINYLQWSPSNGGTNADSTVINGATYSWAYWTMSANSDSNGNAWDITYGNIGLDVTQSINVGARAVVQVSK